MSVIPRGFFHQRSQSMVEFAIVMPLVLLLLFGVIDFGRALYFYITIQQAVNEGARTAVRASYYTDYLGVQHLPPSDLDVQNIVRAKATATFLAPSCPNGPIPPIPSNPVAGTDIPLVNQGWIFITDPSGGGTPNAPQGGLGGASFSGSPPCYALTTAQGNEPLRVTIEYNFVPLTPLIQQVTTNHLILTAWAVYRAEYAN